jgi:hypothetical protein
MHTAREELSAAAGFMAGTDKLKVIMDPLKLFMNILSKLVILAIVAGSVFLPGAAIARDTGGPVHQRIFATPNDAIKALRDAAKAGDHAQMEQIFGPRIHEVMTGDKVQDQTHFEKFSKNLEASCRPEPESADKIFLNIGAEGWAFPIPLVKSDGQWKFDTDAGIEELINRHIGRDELNAIALCRKFADSEKKYFGMMNKYAQKFKSAPGQKDGLYWEAGPNEQPSPFGSLVEEAHEEGYGNQHSTGLHQYHGYIFKILTAQGPAAPGGKKSYVENGNLTAGDLHREPGRHSVSAEFW